MVMLPTIDFGFATVSSFNLITALVAAVGFWTFMTEWQRRFESSSRVWVIGVATFITAGTAGLAGATVWQAFRPDLLDLLFGVTTIWVQEASRWLFAGLLSSVLAAALVLRGTGQSILKGLDALAPSLALGQVIYRIGCFLAGDGCYGPATDLPWGVSFPNGTVPVSVPVHPTMLYDAALMLCVFGLLWYLRRSLPPGASIALFLALTSAVCFVLQFYMLNVTILAGLTEPQVWSLLVGPTAAGAFAWCIRGETSSTPTVAFS